MEILFRGFHKQAAGPTIVININGVAERGRWVYGYYVGPVGILDTHEIADINDVSGAMYDVEPSTVGAYTGLTDKSGKKIFNGDRVRVPMYRHTSTVPFFMDGTVTEGKAAFHVEWDDENCGSHFVGYLEGVEVIGTIYDTPPEGAANV